MTITSNDPALLIADAEASDAFAQFSLAEAYREGDNLPQDLGAALRWYRASAKQGHAEAQNNLGSMYLNGMGTEKNVAEAIRWYREAAEPGQADAEWNLGVRYREGDGVPQGRRPILSLVPSRHPFRLPGSENGARHRISFRTRCATELPEGCKVARRRSRRGRRFRDGKSLGLQGRSRTPRP